VTDHAEHRYLPGGVLADATLKAQTPSGVRKVIAPKVSTLTAAWDVLGVCQPCAGATLFSSIASLLGECMFLLILYFSRHILHIQSIASSIAAQCKCLVIL
jgi:hypothetical protein